jgi:GxxExxY protein
MKYLYDEITAQIWPAFRKLRGQFSAHRGYSENEKRNALLNELKAAGLAVSKEVPVVHTENGKRIGYGRMDLVLECRVVVEVKDKPALTQADIDQLDLYLINSGLPVGVLLNFGAAEANLQNPDDLKKVFIRRYKRENDPTLKA